MPQPNVLVLRSPGANCDEETAEAWRLAGAAAERVHVNRLLEHPELLDGFQVLCLPGGFSYGDDLAAGRVLGNQLRRTLAQPLQRFRDAGKLVLGICNGFQVLMQTGLLDLDDDQGPQATLSWNDHGRYEARWVMLRVTPGDCVFLRGLEQVAMPIAHAEGNLTVRDEAALKALTARGRVVIQYADAQGQPTEAFPANPNGAVAGVAGLTDSTGRVLGLMPHPERFLYATQHPQWTRQKAAGEVDPKGEGSGLRLFRNAVAHFA